MLVGLVAKSCPTLVDPKDCSLPGSSVHGILQARILEWVAISSSRSSSQPRNPTQVSCIAGRFFTNWTMYSFSVYSCHLFLISSVSVRSISFLSFIVPIFAWSVSLLSPVFLKRSLVFFYCFPLFLCIAHWGRLSYLSLLFLGTLHSDTFIFPFLLCLSLLFYL